MEDVGAGEGFFVEALTTADVDVAAQGFGAGEGGCESGGDVHAGRGVGGVAGEEDDVAPGGGVGPIGEGAAADDDGVAESLGVEEGGVFGDRPREEAVAADDAVAGAGDDEVEWFGHGGEQGAKVRRAEA